MKFETLRFSLILFIFSVLFPKVSEANFNSDGSRVQNEKLKSRNVLIVGTIDGHLSAFDADDGKIVWTVMTEPGALISSSLNNLEVSERGEKLKLVPSLDGNLFKFDGKKLEPLPVSAESLLRSSYKIGDNLLVIGGKEITGYGINIENGQVHYACNAKGCEQITDVSPEETILIIQRHTQTVRAVSARNGRDQWNFQVSEHRISISQGISNQPSQSESSNRHLDETALLLPYGKQRSGHFSFQGIAKVDMLKGVIGIEDEETKQFKWSQKLSSPIVDVWQIKDGHIDSYDLFSDSIENISTDESASQSMLLVGSYDEKLYVKKSDNEEHIHPKSPHAHFYPLISDGRKREHATDIHTSIYEGNPVALTAMNPNYVAFLHVKEQKSGMNSSHCMANKKGRFSSVKEEVFIIIYHWKEVIAFSCVLTLLVNITVYLICKRMRNKNISGCSPTHTSIESSKSHSQDVHTTNSDELPQDTDGMQSHYVSRYLTDFEPVACLGRGGYGVVFEAKNKIDDCFYAVKRIKLSERHGGNDRIMREVKALAKLDHKGIVRYFNSWVENPPPDWQASKDKEMEKMFSFVFENSEMSSSKVETSAEHNFNFINPLKPFELDLINIPPPRKYKTQFSSEEGSHSTDDSETSDTLSSSGSHTAKIGNKENLHAREGLKNCDMYLYIQMQLCQRKSLRHWLLSNVQERDKKEVLNIFYQIICAVEYVHQCGLIHRDLKPSNIFFSLDGVVKIGDFGLVAPMFCDDLDSEKSSLQKKNSKNPFPKHSEMVGTELYMSPEQVKRASYNHKVDIFSLGMIFFELLVPFKTQNERVKILTKVRKRKFPKTFQKSYECECELASRLLSPCPKERPSASEIKEHPVFQEFQGASSTVPEKSTSIQTVQFLSKDRSSSWD